MKYNLEKYLWDSEFDECWEVVNKFFSIITEAIGNTRILNLSGFNLNPENFGEDLIYKIEEDVVLSYGMNKNTLLTSGDWVVKFSNGCFDVDKGELKTDMCAREVELWQEAFYRGISRYFAESRVLGAVILIFNEGINEEKGTRLRIPLYIQRRVFLDSDGDSDMCRETVSLDTDEVLSVYDSCSDYGTDSFLLDSLITIEGTEQAQLVANFIDNFEINDIHEENWGYMENIPCIFDYSGYHS